jgi:hypothetical protein
MKTACLYLCWDKAMVVVVVVNKLLSAKCKVKHVPGDSRDRTACCTEWHCPGRWSRPVNAGRTSKSSEKLTVGKFKLSDDKMWDSEASGSGKTVDTWFHPVCNIYVYVDTSISLSVCLYISICLSICLCLCLSVCLSVCLWVMGRSYLMFCKIK